MSDAAVVATVVATFELWVAAAPFMRYVHALSVFRWAIVLLQN